jgi:hypothetical protein
MLLLRGARTSLRSLLFASYSASHDIFRLLLVFLTESSSLIIDELAVMLHSSRSIHHLKKHYLVEYGAPSTHIQSTDDTDTETDTCLRYDSDVTGEDDYFF